MNVCATNRYEEAVNRNLQQVKNRFHGVNTAAGGEGAAFNSLLRTKIAKYSLPDFRIHVGIRKSDERFDGQLQAILDKATPAKPKKMQPEVEAPAAVVLPILSSLVSDIPTEKYKKIKKKGPKAEKQ